MSEKGARYVVRRLHKLTAHSYVAGVRDEIEEARALAKAEFEAGGPHVKTTISIHPSPLPIEVFE